MQLKKIRKKKRLWRTQVLVNSVIAWSYSGFCRTLDTRERVTLLKLIWACPTLSHRDRKV